MLPDLSLRLSNHRLTRLLILIMLMLIGLAAIRLFLIYGLDMDLGHGLASKVDLDWENNLPTYFSTIILLIAAVLLGLIYRHHRDKALPETPRWRLLAAIFLLLSIDEASSGHELLITPLREMFQLSGLFYFSWVIIAVPVVFVLGALYLRFLVRLPATTRNQFLLAAALYLGGALGLELLGGYTYSGDYKNPTLTYELVAHTEELLEMTGTIVFIHALLGYIARYLPSIHIRATHP